MTDDAPTIEGDRRANVIMDPLLGDVLTAMFSQSANLSNSVIDNLEEDRARWASAFIGLFDKLERINQRVDSMAVDRLLEGFGFTRESAQRILDQYTGDKEAFFH